MRFFIKLIKGVLIGISVVIPGVSGGTIAISMGIYDQLVDFASIGKATMKKLRGIFPFALGIALGVALFSFVIEWLFVNYPLETSFAFTGMILGAMPMLVKKVQGHSLGVSRGLILIITAAIMVLLPVASENSGASAVLSTSFLDMLLVFGLGIVSAATLVIPGVSGSMVLMLLGFYEPILQYINSFTLGVFQLQFQQCWQCLGILAPFALGVALGVIIMSRIITLLFKRFPISTYYAIIGLVVASPYAVLHRYTFSGIDFFSGTLCLLLAGAGFVIAMMLGKGEEHQNAGF